MECAAESDGIRVNTVHPEVIDTPIWTKLPVSAGSDAAIDPNAVAKASRKAMSPRGTVDKCLQPTISV
jgi:NAD(P)-dependent dehydrogenase (short-subunit alcohol dehydrogenase family)